MAVRSTLFMIGLFLVCSLTAVMLISGVEATWFTWSIGMLFAVLLSVAFGLVSHIQILLLKKKNPPTRLAMHKKKREMDRIPVE